jgi:hypothetical protein
MDCIKNDALRIRSRGRCLVATEGFQELVRIHRGQDIVICISSIFPNIESRLKLDLTKSRMGEANFCGSAQDRDQWWALVHTAMNLRVPDTAFWEEAAHMLQPMLSAESREGSRWNSTGSTTTVQTSTAHRLLYVPRCVLLEKLPVAQLLKNFSAFYWTGRFITAFTTALPRSLPKVI